MWPERSSRRVRGALAAALLLLLAACAVAPRAAAPVEIALGTDACEYCHMAIDDPDRAAEWIEKGGHAHKFDEPGCLLAWLQNHPGSEGTAFLADLDGSGWMGAQEARLVKGAVKTSMGFDIVALRDASAAAARAAKAGGAVLTWNELRKEGVKDAHAR